MPPAEVSLESSRVPGIPADWHGIRFTDSSNDLQSSMTWTRVAHGVDGTSLESAAPDLVECTFRENSRDGLQGASGSLNKTLWLLDGNDYLDGGDEAWMVAPAWVSSMCLMCVSAVK